ncbi:DUF3918 domain-containing protein [Bacillus lacus]|uniref:DUF3918 domain-containing protein n=1 Tax=Metabacillus lacus TaxID=1983721 RepID=A0A7X2IYB4_9BACI|nr:YrzQ family protein [Metabacillus lacus]MRX71368.1 DUF3918 domain-containing protein [Metabacillus lacus]
MNRTMTSLVTLGLGAAAVYYGSQQMGHNGKRTMRRLRKQMMKMM